MIPFRRNTSDRALALAEGYAQRISTVIPSCTPVEITWSDEGDWSLSLQSGANTYAIHPTDKTYREFVLLRHTIADIETIAGPLSLEEVLGKIA